MKHMRNDRFIEYKDGKTQLSQVGRDLLGNIDVSWYGELHDEKRKHEAVLRTFWKEHTEAKAKLWRIKEQMKKKQQQIKAVRDELTRRCQVLKY